SRRRHTSFSRDWSSDVCSSDLSVVLRQNHAPGERSFVDYCDGIALIDPVSGAKVPTELFVGALGASSYTFAMASLSQELPAWLELGRASCRARVERSVVGGRMC